MADEIVALGLILDLQQKGGESIDLITTRLGKFDEMLSSVDESINTLDSRVSSIEDVLGGLTGTITGATGALDGLAGKVGEVAEATITGGGSWNEYGSSVQEASDYTWQEIDAMTASIERLTEERDALLASTEANTGLAASKGEVTGAAGAAAEAIGGLAGAEAVEGAASLEAAGSNQKLTQSKEELAAAADAAKMDLFSLSSAESAEAAEATAAAGANEKLMTSKEQLAAEAIAAQEAFLQLTIAEAEELAEAEAAAAGNQKLAAAKGQVATEAELAAQAERDLAEAELLEAYEAIKDAGATDNLFMSKTQLINASRLEAATDAEVAEAEMLEAYALQAEITARAEAIGIAETEAATLELLVGLENELATGTLADTAATEGFTLSLAGLTGAMDGLSGSAVLGFLTDVKNIAVDVAEAIGLVAVAGGVADVAALKWASDFQDSMVKLEALSGTSHEQILHITDDLIGMSQQSDVSATKMGDAMYFITSSEFKGAAAMDVLTSSSEASAAGLGKVENIASTVTNVISAYGVSASEAGHVTDVLTKAVIEGHAEADQVATSWGRFLPIMAAANISLEEGAAIWSVMTLKGLSADEAATALRQTINGLVAPTKQASDEMRALGLSAEGVKKEIAEKGLAETLEHIISLTQGDMDSIRNLIPNIRAMTGVLGAVGPDGGNLLNQVLGNIRDSVGQTDKSFEIAQNSISFQMGRLVNDIKSVGIEIGDALIPEVDPMIHKLGDWFIDLSHSTATFLASVKALSTDNGLDGFDAILAVAGRSIGENFGPENEKKFDNITQTIGDLAEGAGTSFRKIQSFVDENILPIPDTMTAIFSTDGGMKSVLDAVEGGTSLLGARLIGWVDPSQKELTQTTLPALGTAVGNWFETEAPVLEARITKEWVPSAVKWAEVSAADIIDSKMPKLTSDLTEWAVTKGAPALVVVGLDLAQGISDGMTQGLEAIVPDLINRLILEPFKDIGKDVGNIVSGIQRGVPIINAPLDKSDPFGDRHGDMSTSEGRWADQGMIAELQRTKDATQTLDENLNNNLDAAARFMEGAGAVVRDSAQETADAAAQIEQSRADLNGHITPGDPLTAREIAAQEAAAKKAEAEQKRQEKAAEAEAKRQAAFAAAHDPAQGLLDVTRDNKQGYIDEFGKLGGALASALDESLVTGTTEAGKKVGTALEAAIGGLRTADVPDWQDLGKELEDALYGAMRDPKNADVVANAQQEIGKISQIIADAATAKQGEKFWDEWAKGGQTAADTINKAIDAAADKIEAAHKKAAEASQAAWDKLNLTRELDAAHQKVEDLMKDYQTIAAGAKVDQSRGREDVNTNQTRENQIQDLQEKRVEAISDSEQTHERALADLRQAHLQKLADIHADHKNKNQEIDIKKENEKFAIEMANLVKKDARENTDRTTKWAREDETRATSWSREDARREAQRTQQDADRAAAYKEADDLKNHKYDLEVQLGIDKGSLEEANYQKELTKINTQETTSVQAALDNVDKITAAAETKLDELWAKLVVKYKGLFKDVTGGQESDQSTAAAGVPGTDYASMVGQNDPNSPYVTATEAQTTAHQKLITTLDTETDTQEQLGSIAGTSSAEQITNATTLRETMFGANPAAQQLVDTYEAQYGALNRANAAETARTKAIHDQIVAQGQLAAAYAQTQKDATAAATAETAAASVPPPKAAQDNSYGGGAGGGAGTGFGGPNDMSSTFAGPNFGGYYPSWVGTGMPNGNLTGLYGPSNGQGSWNNGGMGWMPQPKLADGGIAMKSMSATIGDGNEPEAVLPLSMLPSLMPPPVQSGTPPVSATEIAEAIVKALQASPIQAIMDPMAAAAHLAGPLRDGQRDGRWNLNR